MAKLTQIHVFDTDFGVKTIQIDFDDCRCYGTNFKPENNRFAIGQQLRLLAETMMKDGDQPNAKITSGENRKGVSK